MLGPLGLVDYAEACQHEGSGNLTTLGIRVWAAKGTRILAKPTSISAAISVDCTTDVYVADMTCKGKYCISPSKPEQI